MTQLTTLTPAAVRAVLLGLSDHSSGTLTDAHRVAAVEAMADALTGTRPVDPDLSLLRGRLANVLGYDDRHDEPTDDDLVLAVRETIARLTAGGDRFRDLLGALLDLDPSADDQDIVDTATARAAQRALERSAAKTAALVTPASTDLRARLVHALGAPATSADQINDDLIVTAVAECAAGQARSIERGQMLKALLDLPPHASDEELDTAIGVRQQEWAGQRPVLDRRPQQLVEALGVPMPSTGWPGLLNIARGLAEDAEKGRPE